MIQCPHCSYRSNVVKNGIGKNKVQRYLCNSCNRQFVDRKFLKYKKDSNKKSTDATIMRLLERGNGIRDIQYGLMVSKTRILTLLLNFSLLIIPKLKKYRSIQIDELWSYVKKKKSKKWMIYAYCHETKEILAAVFGRRNSATVRKLHAKLKALNVEIEEYCTDTWVSFIEVFKNETHRIGKKYTKPIEGINCLFRHRVSRLVRKTCCFSKKLKNHIKSIEIVIAGINSGTAWAT
jgi:IS1 family transposase/DNA-directed RNA polymerase subunit RPC12/RpoP